MSRGLTLLLLLCASVSLAGAAGAADFGANDDTGKYLGADGGSFFSQMAATGLKVNVMSVHWDPAAPDEIEGQAVLDQALPLAAEKGIRVVFALYGARPTTFTDDGGSPDAFAAWAVKVVQAYPAVREVIIGNEPNQPRFWRPQFGPDGEQESAASFGRVLAAAYDALKAADPTLRVIGLGLSPRGNDRPFAASNISTSPVRFLRSLGDWYRASGRRAPLMDALSFHPYPNGNGDDVLRGYPWPNAGVANLGRIKQALWDAFHGTAQPTIVNGLRLYLDEVGWQVDTSASDGYTGVENVPVTGEARQAEIYGHLVRLLGCDPSVEAVNLFGFQDDIDRLGFQAGLMRRDGTLRPAADVVRAALAETGGGCLGPFTTWRVARGVIGAEADFGNLSQPRRVGQTLWRFSATAGEEASFTAGIFRAGTPKPQIARRLSGVRAPVVAARGTLRAYRTPLVTLAPRVLPPGRYVYGVRLAAAMNPARTTVLVSRPFRVLRAR